MWFDLFRISSLIEARSFSSVIRFVFTGPAGSQRSRESALSLGLVNDLEDQIIGDETDEPRQLAGDELVSSSSKWHKHTVKVYSLLKRSMAGPEDEEGPKPDHLSFDSLSRGSSRRTAAGVFFELLQLKTWDFIELDQDESYGDIKVREPCAVSFSIICFCNSLMLFYFLSIVLFGFLEKISPGVKFLDEPPSSD